MALHKAAKNLEDRWFREKENELIAQLKRDREKRIKEEAEKENRRKREELKKAHWMRCPKCGHELEEKELYRIKIDTCRLCEGVFFDRGELEELMMARQAAERKGFFRCLMGLQAD